MIEKSNSNKSAAGVDRYDSCIIVRDLRGPEYTDLYYMLSGVMDNKVPIGADEVYHHIC
jgi:hypothetical protein